MEKKLFNGSLSLLLQLLICLLVKEMETCHHLTVVGIGDLFRKLLCKRRKVNKCRYQFVSYCNEPCFLFCTSQLSCLFNTGLFSQKTLLPKVLLN